MLIDPRSLTDAELEAVVRGEVRGCLTPAEAKSRIDQLFLPKVSAVEVRAKGEFQMEVFLKPYPHSAHFTFICDL